AGEGGSVGRRGRDRWRRCGAALPRRPHSVGPHHRVVPGRHARGQHQRRAAARLSLRSRAQPASCAAGGHRIRRLVHDVFNVDAGDAEARRGTPVATRGRQHRRQRGAWTRSRMARPVDGRSAVSTEYLKLTAYFAERLRSGDRFLADALLDLYEESAVATSVVLRGIASFGPHHVLRSDQSLSASEDSPIVIAAVDHADKIASLADRAVATTTRGLVTLERARMLVGPEAAPPSDTVKLTVYIGRQDRVSGLPA